MITENDLKRIYQIVDQFGGDQKPTLKGKITSLLNSHDRAIKNEIRKRIESI